MKKILFTILISSFAFGQLLNNSEKEVIPVKKDSDIIRQVDESLISPMIILAVSYTHLTLPTSSWV